MRTMIVQLAKSIREYKKASILTPVLVVFEVALEVIIPFLMSLIIDNGINNGNIGFIAKIGIALVGAAMLALFFGAMAGKYGAIASAGFAKNLRKDMYYNIQNFSFSNIDKFSTPSLVTRMTTDVTNVQNSYQMMLRIMVRSPIMIILSLIMAFQINPELPLVMVVAVPVMGAGLFLIIKKAFPHFNKVFKTYDKLNNVVQENLRGIRVVKSYVREDHEVEKFESVSEDIYNQFAAAERVIAFGSPLLQFTLYSSIIVICWLGAQLIVGGSMATGQLMSLMAYMTQILMNLMMLSMVLVMFTISRTSAQRIVEVLQEQSDLTDNDHPVFQIPDGSVKFENVSFSYTGNADKFCLTGVNLDIKSGQTVGILGGTGSSKSTLVQLIPRLYDATRGSVKVGGRDVRDYDIEALRDQVAMVLQKNVLFAGTVKENLRWGNPNATDEELVRVCKQAQADDFIQQMTDGYDSHVEQEGANFSGGQRQRLCIARALLKKPKILILDDSTSAVDTRTDKLIRQAFAEEIPNTTKFIIAQRVASVEDADQIIIMEDGAVKEVGSHSELMTRSSIYREVYESQTKGSAEAEETPGASNASTGEVPAYAE